MVHQVLSFFDQLLYLVRKS